MKLTQLLSYLPEPVAYAGPDPEISAITYDSRRVCPGTLFVAVWHPGYGADGHAYAADAAQKGAAALVVEKPVDAPAGTPVVTVERTPPALGWLSAGFYGMPAAGLGLAGVTGTDGKTTTSTLTAAILEAAGFPTGMVTTVAAKSATDVRPNEEHTSTPEAVEIQALLAQTVAGGHEWRGPPGAPLRGLEATPRRPAPRAVIEATSHALHQDRLAGCEFDVAVVTRVTHEHLDYHGTREAYLAAKARLLELLRPDPAHPKRVRVAKAAVLNADDESCKYMAARSPVPVIRFGIEQEAAVRAVEVREWAWCTECRVVSPWGEAGLALPLPGSFNVYNALAALAAACTLGAPLDVALACLATHPGVAGRMERVDAGQPFTVVVDYAHTPDSLARVLAFLRPRTAGKLITVFGSAGQRDRAKRPWMGRIAAQRADYFVLTDEDPRLEDRHQILAEIAAGAAAGGAVEGRQFERIPDRRRAIAAAFARAAAGDTVLLAGKGHERSILGAAGGALRSFPWDERAVARQELEQLGYERPARGLRPEGSGAAAVC